ncbi:unnamed protein product [Haemonchus placei]|uniref:Transmembrane protein 208 n=1 Tax=Haemonchus placei TaxID=6290 RepID=A0A0N4WLG9_HAEPC|nr:unnamed protein product [Haemonchus placei]
MNFNPDYETIATAFVQHYYSKFDQGDGMARAQGLGDLYDPENSYMSFEGVQCKGRDAILAKFSSLTFKQIQRAITKCDSQPLYDGSILVMVLGQLKVCFSRQMTTQSIHFRKFLFCDQTLPAHFLLGMKSFVLIFTTTERLFYGVLYLCTSPSVVFAYIVLTCLLVISREFCGSLMSCMANPRLSVMVKVATKGQKEIFEENRSTIITFGAACLVATVVHWCACLFLLECNNNAYIYFGISVFIEVVALAFMKSMAGARFDERGRVTDAGMDLNDPQAFGEYCKDVIIVTVFVQILALYSSFAYLILLVIPAAAAYKVDCLIFFGLILPWITAPSGDNNEEMDDKKMRKRERREKIVYRR